MLWLWVVLACADKETGNGQDTAPGVDTGPCVVPEVEILSLGGGECVLTTDEVTLQAQVSDGDDVLETLGVTWYVEVDGEELPGLDGSALDFGHCGKVS